jgi:hypothetical protein
MRRRIHYQRTGWRDGSPLSGRLLLAPGAPEETQTNHKKTTRHGPRFHLAASPILEDNT